VQPLTALSEYRLAHRAVVHFLNSRYARDAAFSHPAPTFRNHINRIPDAPNDQRLRNVHRNFHGIDTALSGLRRLS
jgi:hypothetical protein